MEIVIEKVREYLIALKEAGKFTFEDIKASCELRIEDIIKCCELRIADLKQNNETRLQEYKRCLKNLTLPLV